MKRALIIAIAAVLGFFAAGEAVEACCGALYPPVITDLTCAPDMLWPPNHKYRDIMVTANVAKDSRDPYNYSVDWEVVSIGSNQPDNAPGSGDGNTTRDCYVEVGYTTDPDTGAGYGVCRARAERCGVTAAEFGVGRTYTVVVRAYARGAVQTLVSEQSCEVYVPHDRGN